jgi:hypothetical protein
MKESMLLSVVNLVILIFCQVEEKLADQDKKHSQAKIWLSELITIGLLFSLKGYSFNRFYSWLHASDLFPTLPSRTRLVRLMITHQELFLQFFQPETVLNIADSFGIELCHPIREKRKGSTIGKKGLSNHRWIVGRKVNIAINQKAMIIVLQESEANRHDQIFNPALSKINGVVLCDSGHKSADAMPDNLKICKRGTWNNRMIIETVFSLWKRVLNAKQMLVRTIEGLALTP